MAADTDANVGSIKLKNFNIHKSKKIENLSVYLIIFTIFIYLFI